MNDIPTGYEMNRDVFANLITHHFHYCFAYSDFLDKLKHVDVIPVHKKNEKCDKTNYRPVSILTNVWKIYEKLMYNQLSK